MPGLRVFRSRRVPWLTRVKIGPSLAKIPLDALLTLTAVRRALSARYDAVHSHEEGGVIGVILAALLRVPHVYDMHSSLPQQLTNFAFTSSRLVRRVFLMPRANDDSPVAGRHRHLPVARGHGARDRPAGAHRAHRKRARFGRRPGHAGGCRRRRAADARPRRDDAGRAVYRNVRSLPGARPAVRRDGHRSRGASRCPAGAGGREARSGGARTRAGACRGHRRRHDVCRRTPAADIPAYLLAADVLVSPRSRGHEHAAQDLPVPAVGQTDRGHAAPDAYAGA